MPEMRRNAGGNAYICRKDCVMKDMGIKSIGIKRIWSIFGIILMLMFLLCGCGPEQINQRNTGTFTVTDATGTAVNISERPQRIVPIGVSTEDMVLSMVTPDRVAAIGMLPNNVPDVSGRIKGRVKSNTESLLSVQPDLVIMPDWVSPENISEIRGMNIPLYVYKTPGTIQEAKEVMGELAKVLKASDDSLIAAMDKDLADIDSIVKAHPDKASQVVVMYTRLGVNGGKGSTFDDMCGYMKVTNGAAAIGLGLTDNGTREDLIRINPDVIIIPSDAYNQDQYSEVNMDQLYSDPALQGVKAIQNHRVYTVDARMLMSYSQFMTKAMLEMTRYIYNVQ